MRNIDVTLHGEPLCDLCAEDYHPDEKSRATIDDTREPPVCWVCLGRL